MNFVYVVLTFLLIVGLWVFTARLLNENKSGKDKREIPLPKKEGNIISLHESLTQEIYIEALDINYRQEQLNSLVAKGVELTEDIQNEQVKIEHDRKRLVSRSLRAGLINSDKVSGTS